MKMIWDVDLDVGEAADRLTEALMQRRFGVLHVHDLKQTLNSKGVPFAAECRVMEVCNPQQAAKVLADDIDLNMALPCRVSVYEHAGATRIGMLSPRAMLNELSESKALEAVATEVEATLCEAIDEVARGRPGT